MDHAACAGCGHNEQVPLYSWPPYSLHACRECGSTRIVPLPDEESLGHYYDHDYAIVNEALHTDAERRAMTYRDTRWILGLLRRHVPGARRVAEVGCAYGYLLWGLRRAGYDVTGYELSSTTAAVGRTALGLPIRTQSLPDPGETYEAIIMRHVLEHFRDPRGALDRLTGALTPGGILVIATPNPESVPATLFGREWEWMSPPAHLHLFTARGLRSAVGRRGLSVEGMFTRRGDARPFGLAFLRWLAVRMGVKDALSQKLGTFGPDSMNSGMRGTSTVAKRVLFAGFAALDVLAAPAWWVACRRGVCEELWCIARR